MERVSTLVKFNNDEEKEVIKATFGTMQNFIDIALKNYKLLQMIEAQKNYKSKEEYQEWLSKTISNQL